MIIDLMRWWYGPGWLQAAKRIRTRTLHVGQAFAAGTLLKTLFAPWKRIQYTGKSFDAKMQALADNLISRTIGFVVRLGVLFAAGVLMLGSLVVGIAITFLWPFVPLTTLYLLIQGVSG